MDAISQLLAVLRVSEFEAYHNAQVKRFPDGSAVVQCFDRCIIREAGLEAAGGPRRDADAPEGAEAEERRKTPEAASLARARRRAKSAVYDLAMSTDFEWFVTLTLDADKVDRYDPEEVFRHLHPWLDNNVRRRGLSYVLIPELHKDGALHFHGLFNDALPVVDSGTVSMPGGGKPRRPRSKAQRASWLAAGGHVVYNLPGWGWGFSTAIRLYGDRAAAVGYVCKYITKTARKIGGRWYYSGGDLCRPQVYSVDLDFDAVAALGTAFTVDELGCRGVKIRLEGENVDETLEGLRRPAAAVLGAGECWE
jgi:hypothetical protein